MLSAGFSVAGFGVGAIVGLTGVGGGSLMTPVLMLIFGVAPATAVGTDLLFAGMTKSVGAISHARRGNVDSRLALLLAGGSFPGALLALGGLALFPVSSGLVRHVMSAALGAMLVLTALSLCFRARLLAWAGGLPDGSEIRAHGTAATVAIGACIGIAVTLTSVGAGAIGVAALLILHPRLPALRIVGTDIAHAVPILLTAGAGHAMLGHIDASMLASLLAGSIPGILLGSWLSAHVPERLLRSSLALMLFAAGGRLVLA